MVTNNSFKVKNGLVVSSTATILSTASSISTDTGAVIIAGGVGIGGDLYVGGRIVASELTVQYTTVTTTIVETDDIITTFNTTTSTSTDTGALVIAGGAGIGRDLYVGGSLNASSLAITEIVSGNQYALTMKGSGSGDQWAFTVGSTSGNNNITSLNDAGNSYAPFTMNGSSVTIGTIGVSATSSVTIDNNGTVSVIANTVSSSTDTGALTVAGGAGFGGDINIGGTITAAGTGTIGGLTLGQDGVFPPVLDEFGTTILYDGITTSTIRFADGTVQGSRAPVAWTNSKFISVATYYNIDPGIVFSPVIAGGYVYPGDTYFDDGSFGTDPNHLFVMADIGGGQMQFVDITQKA